MADGKKMSPAMIVIIVLASLLGISALTAILARRNKKDGEATSSTSAAANAASAAKEDAKDAEDDAKDASDAVKKMVSGGGYGYASGYASGYGSGAASDAVGRGPSLSMGGLSGGLAAGSSRDVLAPEERKGTNLARFMRTQRASADGTSLREESAQTEAEREQAKRIRDRIDPTKVLQRLRGRNRTLKSLQRPASRAVEDLWRRADGNPKRFRQMVAKIRQLKAKEAAGQPLGEAAQASADLEDLFQADDEGMLN